MLLNIKRTLGFCLALGLAGCSTLPRGAAVDNEILREADDENAGFAIYPVTKAFLPSVATWPATNTKSYNWIKHSHGAATNIIRAGDVVNLRVWDSDANSLLTGPSEPAADLGDSVVSPAGSIFVPYVGKVNIAGRSPDAARSVIQRSLESISPSAQVQLSLAAGRGNSVDLVGGVSTPGNYPMPNNDFSVLSLIAAGGGVPKDMRNPQVRLQRGHTVYGTSIDHLYENPSLDTRLRGGDKVIVEEDDRYFLSLGAAGSEAQFRFDQAQVSALDAVSIIGGVNDTRADPKGILILREYSDAAVRPGVRGPRQTRVVFTLDLTSSDGLFSARNFPIHHKDLVLATESPVTNARTILQLIGASFGVVSAATN
ncbi:MULTISPECIES: polysaccharide biosynthesis/export family protein [Rhodobacterales]|uniref:polysaccharide biosynthesis/export family protein n=1 Tax=Ascidiaceihabitans sp. TaxID=1872644 RepID=UPI0032992882